MEREALERRRRSAAGWFFIIAVLSLLNTFYPQAGSLFGLALTQLSEAILPPPASWLVDAGVLASFVALGLAARTFAWPFLLGWIVYALDALLFMVGHAWLPAMVHVFALFAMFNGFQASLALRQPQPPVPQ